MNKKIASLLILSLVLVNAVREGISICLSSIYDNVDSFNDESLGNDQQPTASSNVTVIRVNQTITHTSHTTHTSHHTSSSHSSVSVRRSFFLNSGDHLRSGETIYSPNGVASLHLDHKCNLLLHYDNSLIHAWLNPDQIAQGPCVVYITKRGTLKLRSRNNKVNVIARASVQKAKYYQLVLNNNGRLRLYAVCKTWSNVPQDLDE